MWKKVGIRMQIFQLQSCSSLLYCILLLIIYCLVSWILKLFSIICYNKEYYNEYFSKNSLLPLYFGFPRIYLLVRRIFACRWNQDSSYYRRVVISLRVMPLTILLQLFQDIFTFNCELWALKAIIITLKCRFYQFSISYVNWRG